MRRVLLRRQRPLTAAYERGRRPKVGGSSQVTRSLHDHSDLICNQYRYHLRNRRKQVGQCIH